MAAVARHRPATRSVKSSSTVSTHNPPLLKQTQQPISLVKRLLFPHLPAGTDPPPLLASPSAPPELNAELYDFIALALRAFVNPWWTKITRYDKEFVVEVNRVLTVIIRVLEGRLLNTDLSPLVFRDLPALVSQHYRDYRNAAAKLSTSYAIGGAASLPQLFHQLESHMAITAEGQIHEDYVRQAVDQILKTCLPSDDYEPETERYIIREIILKVLLDSVAPRVTQPWFIYKLILDQLGPPKSSGTLSSECFWRYHLVSGVHVDTCILSCIDAVDQINITRFSFSAPPDPLPSRPLFSLHTLTFQSLVVFFLSAVQSISTLGLTLINAYKQTVHTIKLVNQSSPSSPAAKLAPVQSDGDPNDSVNASGHSGHMGGNASPAPSLGSTPKSEYEAILGGPTGQITSASSPAEASSNYLDGLLEMLAELLSTHDRFTSSAVMNIVEMVSAAFSPFLDKLLSYMLYRHALSAAQVTKIVSIAKNTLFPNGYPGPSPVDPTPEEQVLIRENLGKRILEKIPPAVSPLFGPTPAARIATVDALLDPLSSAACNRHLFLFILDLVLLTIFPEMAVSNGSLGVDVYGSGIDESSADSSRVGLGLGPGTLSRTTSITPPGSGP
ncbi:hypothetical protein NEOLEDRAFT_1171833 [Neolentinus lepideus HHB14362 ss-1]|uniref:PXA domain-containing protein n=1 Tax=Neolentinus lepideus HHB14362 ss-1 TaxID=1314782 RepID=A0A165PZ59_9AGAM|nr:hypothetical protein NEOLEDRAFT_1171833 [Neolentinus lepideus HHB14362 ss-1]